MPACRPSSSPGLTLVRDRGETPRQPGRRPGRLVRHRPACRRHRSRTTQGERRRRHRRHRRPRRARRHQPRGCVHPADVGIDRQLRRGCAACQGPCPQGRCAMSVRFSWPRIGAVMIKEFIQMRRDRLTFAMIIGIPIAQLVLFGYAINTDPKELPTALVVGDYGPVSRAIVSGMRVSRLLRHRHGVADRGGGARYADARRRRLRHHHPDRLRAEAGARRAPADPGRGGCDRSGGVGRRHRRAADDRAAGRRRTGDRAARRRSSRAPRRSRSSSTGSTIRRASPPTTSCRDCSA